MLATEAPFPQFFDIDGSPLDAGSLYLGTVNLNPETNPITVYWDAAGTQPAAQPIRTLNGYAVRNGTPALIYVPGDYSLTVRNVAGAIVTYTPNSSAFSNSASVLTALNAYIASIATTAGAGLMGWLRTIAYAAGTIGRGLNATPVSVTEYGTGTELGALIQAAVNDGQTSIYVPTRTNWTWTTVVTLPNLWRGRIFGDFGYGVAGTTISAATGHNNPCIDAQGALFVEIEGLHVTANDAGAAAPACFVVFARMLSGASSSNHRVSRCIVEGPFYYCCVYNVGGEELVFENNYFAIYGTAQAMSRQIACVVHQLGEDAFYTAIVTKQARTNGMSCSAIQHRGDVIKNQNGAGGSAIFVGPNVNDITFDLTYGVVAASNSYFLTLDGYFDGIRLGVDRVECDKTNRIVYAPNDVSAGSVSIFKGAYRRSGAQDATKYAIDIGGTTASYASVHVAPQVAWTGTFGGGTEDIYLLRATRKAQLDVSFLVGSVGETLTGSKVTVTTLVASSITMGLAANLTVTNFFFGTKFHFFYEPAVNPTTKAAHVFRGGIDCVGQPLRLHPVTGVTEGANSTATTTGNEIHQYFLNPNGIVGSISTNASATTYATSSDARLKEDIDDAPYDPGLVPSFRVRAFTWKVSKQRDVGFIAQELYQLQAGAVVVGGDDETKNPWGIDASMLIPALVLELQALRQRIQTLEGKA